MLVTGKELPPLLEPPLLDTSWGVAGFLSQSRDLGFAPVTDAWLGAKVPQEIPGMG